MTTALDIITSAMKKAGVLTKSETPAADEANDALASLNAMLSSWSNDSMLVYARTWENFSLTAGDGEYTIGTSQDFNTTRPIQVVDAYARQGTTDHPIKVIPDEVYFSSIWDKSSRGVPRYLNYDNGYEVGKIRLFPVPDTTYTLYLLTEKQLSTFTLNQTVSLPPGWERALVYNLAVEISPEYGQPVDPIVLKIANESKGEIASAILKVRSMDAQPQTISNNNIYTGF